MTDRPAGALSAGAAAARPRFASPLQGPLQRSRGGDARPHTAPPGALPPADRSTRSAARGGRAGAAACDAVTGARGRVRFQGILGRTAPRTGGGHLHVPGVRGAGAAAGGRSRGARPPPRPGPAPPAAHRDGPSRAGRALPLLSRWFRPQASSASPFRRSRSSPLRALGRFLSTLKSVSDGGAVGSGRSRRGGEDRSVPPRGQRRSAVGPPGRAAGREGRSRSAAGGGGERGAANGGRREEERRGAARGASGAAAGGARAALREVCCAVLPRRASFMNQKQQKPTLSGQRFKTRKRGKGPPGGPRPGIVLFGASCATAPRAWRRVRGVKRRERGRAAAVTLAGERVLWAAPCVLGLKQLCGAPPSRAAPGRPAAGRA